MMMDSFNELLLKLREVHEREVEGWQVKVQELSNKKGCDTKRMEELFTRNQQMKEQQRILTENIKTLENRLRAGLCDRCTVTQEVARRRQQEFEASQIQSLQHISLLTAEMTNLKKENRRLRDDIRTLKAALEDQSERSNSSSVMDGKPLSSPERPPSSEPGAGGRSREQAGEGDMRRKTEAEQQDEETEGRTQRMTSHLDSYKHLLLPTVAPASGWRSDHNGGRAADRRAPGVEALGHRPSFPSQPISKSFPSPSSAEVKPSRHLLHAPVPRHPQPIKASALSLPWPLTDPADWVTLTAVSSPPLIQTSPRVQLSHFPSLPPSRQQLGPRRPVFSPKWQKQSPPPPSKEPTVVVSLSALPQFQEVPSKPHEGEESPPSIAGRAFPAEPRDPCDAPLDLSDHGKSKAPLIERDSSPWASPSGSKLKKSCESLVGTGAPVKTTARSPSPEHPEPQSPSADPMNEQEEEAGGPTEQEDNKKVPVLTISLRPVVVLESLNSALQKQESLSSNGKRVLPAEEEPEGTEDHPSNEDPHLEAEPHCKRKRPSKDAENDGESGDADDAPQERKIRIAMRTEEKSNG